ncbi:MAG: hypothetical protein KatS3mg105_4414 [Gemmatales bacterium]|nr:MAG: hypothetical protein KatS3mg105_4414 [Gemmatales bacterium]
MLRRTLKTPFVDGLLVAFTPRRSLKTPLVDGGGKLHKIGKIFLDSSSRAFARTEKAGIVRAVLLFGNGLTAFLTASLFTT